MPSKERLSRWIFGVVFGAWLGGVYALVSQAINWIYLPDIPLAPPSATPAGYVVEYLVLGALLGWICSIPENRYVGMLLGGGFSALCITILALQSVWGGEFFSAALILLLLTFMPLILLMVPIAFIIRLGVDAQQVDPERPYLWARRYIIPAFLTLVVVVLGTFTLYPKDQREAFQYVHDMIQQGQQSSDLKTLPEPLQDVRGFMENARGGYQLSWSDRVETFFGPVPVGPELSQFLIIARFENGYALACVFSGNRPKPNCADY